MDKEKTPELAVHPRAEEWSEEQPQVTEVRRAQLKRNDQLKLLCQQIKAGKPHLRSQLRNLLRQESPEDIKGIADLTELVADRWASQIAPNSEVARGCIVVDAMDQRLALAPPGSTTIEQILASRVVLCSLQQSYHELQMTAVAGNADVTGTKLGNALERRLQDGNRELENATKIYQKGVSLAAEISSPRPQAGVAALKIYNPDAKNRRKSA